MPCESCRDVELFIRDVINGSLQQARMPLPFIQGATFADTERSSKEGCEFCRFCLDAINHKKLRGEPWFRANTPMDVDYYDEDSGAITFSLTYSRRPAYPTVAVLEPFRWPTPDQDDQISENEIKLIPGRYLPDNPTSEESFAWIEALLNNCCGGTYTHMNCASREGTNSSLSSRILDLEPVNEKDIRLVATPLEAQGRYAALSHCWGEKSSPLLTTSTNVEAHMRCISLQCLPRSFQDAVEICRRLSIRYLWLDTLCILQDSQRDWTLESSKMGAVYENAQIVIAFSAAVDCHQPVLSERTPLRSIRLANDLAHLGLRPQLDENLLHYPQIETPLAIQKQNWDRDFKNCTFRYSALGRREWAYQEMLLARRVLYFTACQLA